MFMKPGEQEFNVAWFSRRFVVVPSLMASGSEASGPAARLGRLSTDYRTGKLVQFSTISILLVPGSSSPSIIRKRCPSPETE